VKFICDDNLGKLAKYLRILGFDTHFEEPIDDAELLRIAASQQRWLLTRDHHLANRSHPYGVTILEDDDSSRQLSVVIQSLSLRIDPELLFHRCSLCNAPCRIVDKSQIGDEVFPFILKTQEIISQCPSCKRYYWKGSHYKKLIRKLKGAIPDNALTGEWPIP
jgi:uncharacterized protein with PIN domain